jgi:putative ABC transport system permease protein
MASTVAQDARIALRTFARAPRFTIPAVLALALGVGATSAVFAVVRGVLLAPLPYPDPDRVVSVWESNAARNRTRNVVAAQNFVEWRARNRSFSVLGMVGPARLTIQLDGVPEEVAGQSASADVFRALGVPAARGRVYEPAEDLAGQDGVIVLSHEFWQGRLAGRADVIGLGLVVAGRPREVVGVMPPGFTIEGEPAAFYVPYGWTEEQLRAAGGRGSSHGIARMKDGVTLAQAQADMVALAAQLAVEKPRLDTGWSVTLVPIHEQTVGDVRPALLVLAGAVLVVLLIACVNVANLLLARSTVRARELQLRAAFGAGRGRLVRQLVTESLVLAAAGGAAGLGLALLFHRGLLALAGTRVPIPRLAQTSLDAPVVAATLALALVSGLAVGLVPALTATGALGDGLRDGGRHGAAPRARRALHALVIAEVALSLVLLTAAGLLGRSLLRLQDVDPGFRTTGVLTARVQVPPAAYREEAAVARFYAQLVARAGALPGVQRAAAISFPPLAGPGMATSFHRLDQPAPPDGQAPTTDVRPVSPGYFRTMDIPLRAGRDVAEGDTLDAPLVAVVSAELARQQFGDASPLGRRLHVNIGRDGGMDVEVVGVSGDVRLSSLTTTPRPIVFLPHAQLPIGVATLMLRTDLPAEGVLPGLRAALRELDAGVPLADVQGIEALVGATLARPRALSLLIAAFAVMALLLAAVGVYGVMAYAVAQRTQEIGVRMALGASTEAVFRLVLRQAAVLVGGGIGLGLVVAAATAGLLRTQLFGIEPLDPWTFAGTATVLAAIALLASYVPARRGMRIDPIQALRAD